VLPAGQTDPLHGRGRDALERALPQIVRTQRWFGGKARRIKAAAIEDVIPVATGEATLHIVFVRVDYLEGDPERYVVPLGRAAGAHAQQLRETQPGATLATLELAGDEALLYDATWDPRFGRALLAAMSKRRRLRGESGELVATPSRAFREIVGEASDEIEPARLGAEQSNSSIRYGERALLKLFRRLEGGVNPDLEITAFLTDRARFAHVPPLAGQLEFRPVEGEAATLGILQGFVPNEGDAWHYTLDGVGRYFDRVASLPAEGRTVPADDRGPLELAALEPEPLAREMIGTYLEAAHVLGRRTAELHLALASNTEDPAFAPEPFTPFYQRSLYQSMRNLTEQTLELLAQRGRDLPEEVQAEASRVCAGHERILTCFRTILERRITALRTRHHGDFHLGQVLWTGRDFVIFDFEGEPARPLSARKIKRSPLRDVAGMMRSFHYAARHGLATHVAQGMTRAGGLAELEAWADFWHARVSAAFLRSSLETAGPAPYLPHEPVELQGLVRVYLLEKALYELGYELNHRPQWVGLPLRGVMQLMQCED